MPDSLRLHHKRLWLWTEYQVRQAFFCQTPHLSLALVARQLDLWFSKRRIQDKQLEAMQGCGRRIPFKICWWWGVIHIFLPATSSSNLKNIYWDFLDAKLIKKIDAWISDSARLTLLDSCQSGIPSYYMAMFLLNKTSIEKLGKHGRRFLLGWKEKKTYYMVK